MDKHLVFYDGECGLCDRMVHFLLQVDHKKCFLFAPLQGDTAQKLIPSLKKENDSIVLIENFMDDSKRKVFVESQAVFHLFSILGGGWSCLGCLKVFPTWTFDWMYRCVARNRRRFFSDVCYLPVENEKDRFLS